MRKLFVIWLIIMLTQCWDAAAQTQPQVVDTRTVRLSATATIIDNLGLITMRDVDLNSPTIIDGTITVSPITSPFAGLMRISGRAGAMVRITYLSQETLLETSGSGGIVRANYRISGFENDNQAASVLLDIGEANVRLSKDGHYYIWLGAVIDVARATPGGYISEFIIEMEAN
jgi:hypothetical protein